MSAAHKITTRGYPITTRAYITTRCLPLLPSMIPDRLKTRIRTTRVQAALTVNRALILFNRRLAAQRGPTGEHRVTLVGGETIRAFLPHPLPPKPPLDLAGSRTRLLEQATLALGRRDFTPCPTQTSSLCRAPRREPFMCDRQEIWRAPNPIEMTPNKREGLVKGSKARKSTPNARVHFFARRAFSATRAGWQQTEAARLDAAIARNLKELGYGG